MRFFLLFGLRIVALSAVVTIGTSFAAAQNPFNIQFPIANLGDCKSTQECKIYCDEPANIDACVAWAEANGFASRRAGVSSGTATDTSPDADAHKEIDHVLEERSGPGGCRSRESCDAFCSRPENGEICLAFVVENGIMSPDEAARRRSLQNTTGPGGCQSRQECEAYCRSPKNMNECLDFAVHEGHMSADEALRIRKNAEQAEKRIRQKTSRETSQTPRAPRVNVRSSTESDINVAKIEELLLTQTGPGGCDSFEACDAFCRNPVNEETCFSYAVEYDLIPREKVEKIQKLKNTTGPGGCRGRQCETYCNEPGHEDECLDFALQNNLIPQEEATQIKKFMDASRDGGPGGCRGRQCETYCNDPTHQEECFAFAKQNQLLPPDQIDQIERLHTKMQSGGSPGGCRNEKECHEYCSDPSRFDECAAFAVDAGLIDPGQAEEMLREFVNIEQNFSPRGAPARFGRQGTGGFDSTPGFNQGQGQGQLVPGVIEGQDGFLPPPGFEQEFEQEFERRFEQFEKFRGQFNQNNGSPGRDPELQEFPREGFLERQEGAPPMTEQHGQFSGQGTFPARQGFPSQSVGTGPAGSLPTPSTFPGQQKGIPGGLPGMSAPSNVRPEIQQGVQQEFNRQFQQQFNQQYNQESQQEFNRQFQGMSEQQQSPPGFGYPTGTFGGQYGGHQQPAQNFNQPYGTFNQPVQQPGAPGGFSEESPMQPGGTFAQPIQPYSGFSGSQPPPSPPSGSFDGSGGGYPPPPNGGSFEGGSQPPPPPPGEQPPFGPTGFALPHMIATVARAFLNLFQ